MALTAGAIERGLALLLGLEEQQSAALSNLANAVRLIEGQPALAILRLLQTLEAPLRRPCIYRSATL